MLLLCVVSIAAFLWVFYVGKGEVSAEQSNRMFALETVHKYIFRGTESIQTNNVGRSASTVQPPPVYFKGYTLPPGNSAKASCCHPLRQIRRGLDHGENENLVCQTLIRMAVLMSRFLMNKMEALMRIILIRVEALMNKIEALMNKLLIGTTEFGPSTDENADINNLLVLMIYEYTHFHRVESLELLIYKY